MNCNKQFDKVTSQRDKRCQISFNTIQNSISKYFSIRLFLIFIAINIASTEANAQMFSDVPAEHWAYDYIYSLKHYNFIKGKGNNQYAPDITLTRAEMAVFILRGIHGAAYVPSDPTNQVFADVPLYEWYAKWVHTLWDAGFTSGASEPGQWPLLFYPLRKVTRSEACVFFLRMKNGVDYIPPAPGKRIFSDVPRGEWFEKWVNEAYLEGLIPPFETSPKMLFNPNGDVTRAMVAYIMVRANRVYLLVDQNKNRDVTKLPVGSDIKNNLSWYPQVQVDLATQIRENYPESQYYVYVPKIKDYSGRGDYGVNLCGQVCLSMISETVIKDRYTLLWIWEKGTDATKEGTNALQLAKAVRRSFITENAGISYHWDIKTYSWDYIYWNFDQNGENPQWEEKSNHWWITADGKDNFASEIFQRLNKGYFLIICVQIRTHPRGGYNPLYDFYGALAPYNYTEALAGLQAGHWVVITGLTSHWDFNKESISPLNWVRINNPFANRTEYYSWQEFNKSLHCHSMAEISVKEFPIQSYFNRYK